MNERDELVQIIWNGAVADRVKDGESPKHVPVVRPKVEAMADAILAAGYHKPRTITTAEELDALDVGSVIHGHWLASKWAEPEGEVWHVAGKGQSWDTEQLLRMMGLPATVLWEPK